MFFGEDWTNWQYSSALGRLKMQDWKMSDVSARLEFDGLTMHGI